MYQIKCDGYILHDSRSNELRVIEPKCDMELNKTGKLTFSINPAHPFYDKIEKLKSEISLFQDGKWIFTGRVLNDETNIYKFKSVEVEGDLSYLLDSIQRPITYEIESDGIKLYLDDVISTHNDQVETKKQFSVGRVTVKEPNTFLAQSDYKDTLSTINESLIDNYKGYLFTRRDDNCNYLDYITSDDFPINNQVIRFGENLLKLNQNVKGEEIATVIIPIGSNSLTISDYKAFTDGTIIHDEGTDFIYDVESIRKYGYIYKVIKYSDITTAEDLVTIAKKELNYYNKLVVSLELSAFDLNLLDVKYDSIRVGQKIKVISKPHNINDYMIVEKMTINIDKPDKSTITLGTEERTSVDTNKSLSQKNSDVDKYVSSVDNYVTSQFDNDYVTRSEVNSAFNELASLIGGI